MNPARRPSDTVDALLRFAMSLVLLAACVTLAVLFWWSVLT